MGRHAFGSFSASRRSWRAILRQCTRLRLLVDTSNQAYRKTYLLICLASLSKKICFVFKLQCTVGFCWVLHFGLTRRPVWRLLSATKMLHMRPQPANLPSRCPPYLCVAVFLAHAVPNRFLKTKWREEAEERGEREKKKKEGGGMRKGEEGSANRPPECFAFLPVRIAAKCSKSCFAAVRWPNLPILNQI